MLNPVRASAVAAAAVVGLLLTAEVYGQNASGAQPGETRPASKVPRPLFDPSPVSLGRDSTEVPWRRASLTPRRSRDDRGQSPVAKGRSRKKAVLIGAAVGALVGLGGGVYASEATGGDFEPWGVAALAGIGAGVGATCGFLISLF